MDLEQLPSFESTIVSLLGLIGVSASVLALVGSVFALHSWYDGARRTVAGARVAGKALYSASSTLSRMTIAGRVIAVFGTIAILAAQCLTVALCFLGGNYISMSFDEQRFQAAVNLIEQRNISALLSNELINVLTWDWISSTYVVVTVVAILTSYVWAERGRETTGLGAIVGLPALLLLGMACVVGIVLLALLLFLVIIAVFMLLATGTNDLGAIFEDSLTNALPLIVGATICALYYGACHSAVQGSRVVMRMWRPSPV